MNWHFNKFDYFIGRCPFTEPAGGSLWLSVAIRLTRGCFIDDGVRVQPGGASVTSFWPTRLLKLSCPPDLKKKSEQSTVGFVDARHSRRGSLRVENQECDGNVGCFLTCGILGTRRSCVARPIQSGSSTVREKLVIDFRILALMRHTLDSCVVWVTHPNFILYGLVYKCWETYIHYFLQLANDLKHLTIGHLLIPVRTKFIQKSRNWRVCNRPLIENDK